MKTVQYYTIQFENSKNDWKTINYDAFSTHPERFELWQKIGIYGYENINTAYKVLEKIRKTNKNKFRLVEVLYTPPEITPLPENSLNYKLVYWLTNDGYTFEEAIEQINKAKIEKDDNTITITYSNNFQDIVKINDGKIIQIK